MNSDTNSWPNTGPVCGLYVPGDRPDRFGSAVASGADLVVIDLEDAVAPDAKAAAREHVANFLRSGPDRSDPAVELAVRVNGVRTEFFAADLAMLDLLASAGIRLAEVRIPKVEQPGDIESVAVTGHPVAALVESAVGLTRVDDLARVPGLVSVGLGEADLQADLRTTTEDALAYARSRVVVACAAARLRSPAMSVYRQIDDATGLAESCLRGRELGIFGRSAVHPRQVPVIRAAFRPNQTDVAWADEVMTALGAPGAAGAIRLADGSLADAAMRRRASSILAQIGTSPGSAGPAGGLS